MTMALLSESEVAEAPTSASGKLLKVQECALPGRTHAEGLWGGKNPSLQAGAALEEQRRRHGGVPLARITLTGASEPRQCRRVCVWVD